MPAVIEPELGAEGAGLDLAGRQESVEVGLLNLNPPPAAQAAQPVMGEAALFAPAINEGGRDPRPLRRLFDRQFHRLMTSSVSPLGERQEATWRV
jgi:hypothetical protein